MTYHATQKKAPWFRALHGEVPQPKPRKPVRRVSPRQSKRLARYHARVRVWKKDRLCVGPLLRLQFRFTGGQEIPCGDKAHPCQDCHHSKGKPGPLLMDERFWIPVCRELHSWTREHPIEARALGLHEGAWQHTLKEKEQN